jgi:hypothetical protein
MPLEGTSKEWGMRFWSALLWLRILYLILMNTVMKLRVPGQTRIIRFSVRTLLHCVNYFITSELSTASFEIEPSIWLRIIIIYFVSESIHCSEKDMKDMRLFIIVVVIIMIMIIIIN